MKDYKILIVGVGGQGTLLASRVLGALAEQKGYDCKLSEVHGMAQRGGSVVTHVVMKDKVYSPIIDEGNADIILAFEKLEAARWRHYLKKDGVIVVNNQEIYPMPVIIGAREYPQNIIENIKAEGKKIIVINALDIAKEVGNTRTVNTIMIGAMAKNLGFTYEEIEKAVSSTVKPKLLAINLIALKKGYEL
ncbi:MAG: indolepyruvate oxidoreductase subunit beta [Clostridia bacterium]